MDTASDVASANKNLQESGDNIKKIDSNAEVETLDEENSQDKSIDDKDSLIDLKSGESSNQTVNGEGDSVPNGEKLDVVEEISHFKIPEVDCSVLNETENSDSSKSTTEENSKNSSVTSEEVEPMEISPENCNNSSVEQSESSKSDEIAEKDESNKDIASLNDSNSMMDVDNSPSKDAINNDDRQSPNVAEKSDKSSSHSEENSENATKSDEKSDSGATKLDEKSDSGTMKSDEKSDGGATKSDEKSDGGATKSDEKSESAMNSDESEKKKDEPTDLKKSESVDVEKSKSEGDVEIAAESKEINETSCNETKEESTPNKEKASEDDVSDVKSKGSEKKKKKRTCEECGVKKGLKFQMLFQGKTRYMCSGTCFIRFKDKQKGTTKPEDDKSPVPSPKPAEKEFCGQCKKEIKNGIAFYPRLGETKPICSEDCLVNYQESNVPKKKCSQCKGFIEDDMSCLTWETMDFCNEDCLGKFQSFLGSHCTCCQSPVQQTSLGKYSVCFGSDIRQFCSGSCLEEFKRGLKVCSFCQKDLSTGAEGFLAPVGEKGQFKDFCTQQCMERYEIMNSNSAANLPQTCMQCSKIGIYKIHTKYGEDKVILCSISCVAGFRYKKKVSLKMCDTCYKFFDPEVDGDFSLQYEGVFKYYCTKACMTLFVLSHRKIVPCSWCKVKKYNFDMIEKLDSSNQTQAYCSLNCISLYRVSLSATSAKSIRCDNCGKSLPAQYHLTMSDGSIRNFCLYQCVIQFQNQFSSCPTLTTTPGANRQTTTPQITTVAKSISAASIPVISNVMSLASVNPRPAVQATIATKLFQQKTTVTRPNAPSLTIIAKSNPSVNVAVSQASSHSTSTVTGSTPQVVREVIVKPPPPKSLKNKAVLCKPIMHAKAVTCKPHPCHKAVQTDEGALPTILPIPVPVYIPTPVHMFSRPVPCPVPFPVPIPVPIFVPMNKYCPTQIIKKLKDIQDKMPSNPYEAEVLMMAEMVAENDDASGDHLDIANSPPNLLDDDMSHIPLSDCLMPPDIQLDLEAALPPGIGPVIPKKTEPVSDDDEEYLPKDTRQAYGKRTATSHGRGRGRGKKNKVETISLEDLDTFSSMPMLEDQLSGSTNKDLQDTSTRLKHTFGVNAWRHWILEKNAQLEKGSQGSSRRFKLFKTDLLQLPPDELNYSLSLFVKEIRKPTGDEYAPASIYYLCLGIQQHLFENGRIDNIFTDPYYEKFTECLNDVLRSQDDILLADGFFISRIEEEVLWESKQLGAHSPHVLLNTLMYFNAKYFNLRNVDDHTHLSFSHVTKHWRKTAIKSGPRSVVLRYYPPANKEQPKKKDDNTMYEQSENIENPLRCPVKLFEFYLSKCPESVRTRNDVFYMYPERSCVPDSPVWYSTQALAREMIAKMLQRIKTIREVYEP